MEERVEKLEKMADKAFNRLVFTSFLAIFMCIVCLCTSTFAWFYDSAPSVGNKLKTMEKCLLTVTVTAESNGEKLNNVETGVELKAGEEYTVTLMLPGNSASGYCVIKTDNGEIYTPYIASHDNINAEVVSFTLTVTTTQTVKFLPRWGIYSRDCDITTDTFNIQ